MCKENTNPNIDALLREMAAQDNAALPFGEWKRELLQKAAEEDAHHPGSVLPFHAKEEAGARVPEEKQTFAPEFAGSDMRDERRFARRRQTRRVMIGLSGAAAALLVLLGVRHVLPGGFGGSDSSGNRAEDSLLASEAVPFGMAIPESGEEEMAQSPAAQAPAAQAPAAPAPAAAHDAQSGVLEQPAAEAPAGGLDDRVGGTGNAGGTGGTDGGEADAGAAQEGAQRSGAASAADTAMPALLCVEEALGIEGTAASRAHAEVVWREGGELRYLPLAEGGQESAGQEAAKRESYVPDTPVYIVTLDARQADAPRYVVRQDTLAVLGTLVE